MKPIEVVQSKVWCHTITGQFASIHGAVPWTHSDQRELWSIITRGWTLLMDNGTIGYGQTPFMTRDLAESKLKSWPK